ncbi:hypothetical protein SAMD00019534_086020, partial [Acytostelium subglobosum LB1]|uniref:hypothetical protein n=1 Tax=Acytostelium subglobosum LB1 TaxID=1410327 RepID=UPI000644F01F
MKIDTDTTTTSVNNNYIMMNGNTTMTNKKRTSELIGINNNGSPMDCYMLDITSSTSSDDTLNNTNRFKLIKVDNSTLLPKPIIFKQKNEQLLLKEIMKYLKVTSEIELSDLNDTHKIETIKMREGHLSSVLGFSVLRALLEGCIKESRWNVVACLMALSNGVSSMMMPELIDTIIAKKQDHLIPACIRSMNDISLDDIVKLIKHCLEQQGKAEEGAAATLDCVLSYRHGKAMMVNALRSLTLEQVKQLWQHIFERLRPYLNLEVIVANKGQTVLTMQQLIDWISLLLESHFQEWSQRNYPFLEPYYEQIKSLHHVTSMTGQSKAFLEFNRVRGGNNNNTSNNHTDKDQSKDTNYSIHVYYF